MVRSDSAARHPLKEPGVYCIEYGDTKTGHFIINDNVYDKITDATSDIWIPIHMNHITVNEGYSISFIKYSLKMS